MVKDRRGGGRGRWILIVCCRHGRGGGAGGERKYNVCVHMHVHA